MTVLGIESSCDDCCIALVRDGQQIITEVCHSQAETHAPFGGVVPEIAARAHTRTMLPLFRTLLRQSGVRRSDIDAIAVTATPGLHNSLMVGLAFARALAYALQIPCIDINHLSAHLYAIQLVAAVDYPHVGIIVSGGHTLFGIVHGYDTYEVLGSTVDDACGEAFDKVASHLGVGYPGGVHIERLAQAGSAAAAALPRAALHTAPPFNVSYSGLKTAVIHQLPRFWDQAYPMTLEHIAAAFQDRALEMIVQRTQALVAHSGLTTVVCGGGVCANRVLQERLRGMAGATVHIPPSSLCTDNAGMVAGIGFRYWQAGRGDAVDSAAAVG